jgi:poly(A) polymerase
MTKKRMPKLGFAENETREVSRLVFLSGRFKGYADGWSDSAVRRYARDGGPLLGDLNDLVRSDCTSRNPRTVASINSLLDELETRIAQLAREDAVKAERAEISGDEVMSHLGIGPGREVGQAMRYLLELKRAEGVLGEEEILKRLDQWWLNKEI